MKVFIVAAILGLVAPAFSMEYQLWYNSTYDNKWTSLHDVTCSIGDRGLIAHGYKTLSDLPTYPHVGGAPQITSKDSRYCKSCWEITYTINGDSKCVNFTAIDVGHGRDGFTTSLATIEHLTDNVWKEEKDKSLSIVAYNRPRSWCGLPNDDY